MEQVQVYNLSGRRTETLFFPTVEGACREYDKIIDRAIRDLPVGYGIVVVRLVGGDIMAMRVVFGNALPCKERRQLL